ncbi:MAG: peptidoglycan DD-metalloendopeptidase family protein [Piscirickettsiaceae bacterium]|nr:peptidoglycan DD-metalloendopeptidase family protein [Piscirickettsiaceae bacterium]
MKLLFSLLLLLNISHSWADSQSNRLENVQIEIQSLAEKLNKTKVSKNELYQQLKKQSRAVSKLNRELHKLNQQLQQQSTQLKQIKQQQQQQNKSLATQQQALNEQLRAAYFSAQPNYLKVLLNQSDLAKLSRSKVYFHYFHQARQQQLIKIATALQSLTQDQQQLTAAQQRHQQLYNQRQEQQEKLKSQNKQRLATLKQLDSKLDSQATRLSALHEEEQSLQAVFKSISQKKQTTSLAKQTKIQSTKFAKNKGALPWPIKGKVTARYGSSRNLGKLTWQGIMIKAPAGKEVIASASGRIVFSDWLRGFGLLLIIDHGDQYMTLYGNNQSLLKGVGDTVNARELIALSGDKGIRQYIGLYFEIRHKGSPTNPSKWLGRHG